MKYCLTMLVALLSVVAFGQENQGEVVPSEVPQEQNSHNRVKGKPFGSKSTVKKESGSRELILLKEKTIIRENGTKETIKYEQKK